MKLEYDTDDNLHRRISEILQRRGWTVDTYDSYRVGSVYGRVDIHASKPAYSTDLFLNIETPFSQRDGLAQLAKADKLYQAGNGTEHRRSFYINVTDHGDGDAELQWQPQNKLYEPTK